MPDVDLAIVIRHLVDVQQRLNCALPSQPEPIGSGLSRDCGISLSRVHFRLRGLHGVSEFSRDLRFSRRPDATALRLPING